MGIDRCFCHQGKREKAKNSSKNTEKEQNEQREKNETRREKRARSYYRPGIRWPRRVRNSVGSSRSKTDYHLKIENSSRKVSELRKEEKDKELERVFNTQNNSIKTVTKEVLNQRSRLVIVGTYLKDAIFLFAFFDIQFIVSHELLHSDLTRSVNPSLSSHRLKAKLSYGLSFCCLCLILLDLLHYFSRFWRIITRVKRGHQLTEGERVDAGFMLEDLKAVPKISTLPALCFNAVSIIRFSFYQVIVVSLQLFPEVQTGSLLFFQLLFFIYYSVHYKKHKFFESCFIFIKHLIFEGCILLFLLIAFIFSFKNSNKWFKKDIFTWLQLSAAAFILISFFIELITLIFKLVKNVFRLIARYCCCRRKTPKIVEKKKIQIQQQKGHDQEEEKVDGVIETGRQLIEKTSREEKDGTEQNQSSRKMNFLRRKNDKNNKNDKNIDGDHLFGLSYSKRSGGLGKTADKSSVEPRRQKNLKFKRIEFRREERLSFNSSKNKEKGTTIRGLKIRRKGRENHQKAKMLEKDKNSRRPESEGGTRGLGSVEDHNSHTLGPKSDKMKNRAKTQARKQLLDFWGESEFKKIMKRNGFGDQG